MSLENRPGNRPAARVPVRALVAALFVASSLSTAGFAAFPGKNGRIAAETLRDGDWEIVAMEPEGTAVALLTHNTVLDRQPAWSPDGSKIAFTSNRSGAPEIWVMNADGSGARRLVASPDGDLYPAWSPDGLRIAFARTVSATGKHDIWFVNAGDGSGPTQLTDTDGADESQPAWSPDGSKIAFVTISDSDPNPNREVYVMGSDGSNPVNLTESPFSDENSPDWSPDGASIAFDSTNTVDGETRLFTMAADGSLQEEAAGSEPGDVEPAWSPDGLEVAFAGHRSENESSLAIYRMTVGDGGSRSLVSDSASFGFDERRPDWQPLAETQENRPPLANAGPDGTAECASPQGGEVTLDGSLSSDPDSTPGTNDDIVSFEWFLDFGNPSQSLIATGEVAQVTLPPGSHVVTLRVTDGDGATATDDAVWNVRDTAPPTISVSVDPSVLWPPNHKMVPVHATVTATDLCGAASVVLAAVTSSEPDDSPGEGDGHTVNDIQGADIGRADYDLLLRAERSGNHTGRVYAIVYTATDAAGNFSSARATVLVPHDAGDQGLALSHRREASQTHRP
jgi:Tol biopolymer transport system component